VQRWLRRPAVAHLLWVLVLVKLVTPPLVSVPLSDSPGSMDCTLGACHCGPQTPTQAFVSDTLPWLLLGVWSAGAGATGWIAWRRWARFRQLIVHASPAPPEWQSLAARLAAELSIRCSPEILAVPGQLPPLVVPGRRRPRLLLPMDLMDQLGDSQKAAILLHELAHIRRGDHRVRVLELVVGVVYWWLPVVGSIGRQLRACEESCCDAAVVDRLPEARREYARLLLDVLDFASPLSGQTGLPSTAMSVAEGLEQRLLAILDASGEKRRTSPTGAFAVVLACAILPCELHYNFASRPTPSTSVRQEPPAGATPSPGGEREDEPSKALCCPS